MRHPYATKAMDCREFLLRYSDYDDSLLPSDEAARFRAHMAECPSCARYDRVLRKGRMLARQIPGPKPSSDFVPRLRLRLLRGRADRGHRSGSRDLRLATGLAAATVLMAAVTAVALLQDAPPGQGGQVASGAGATSAASGSAPTIPVPTRAVVLPRSPRLALLARLPAKETATPRAWAAREVDPADTASYSPLVTGPPVYRAAHPLSRGPTTDRRALD